MDSAVGKGPVTVVAIEIVRRSTTGKAVPHVCVEMSIVVKIAPGGAEGVADPFHPRIERNVCKRPVAVVAVEEVYRVPRPRIACDQDVRVPVVVIVRPEHTPAADRFGHSRLIGDIRKGAVPIVLEESVFGFLADGQQFRIAVTVQITPAASSSPADDVNARLRGDFLEFRDWEGGRDPRRDLQAILPSIVSRDCPE